MRIVRNTGLAIWVMAVILISVVIISSSSAGPARKSFLGLWLFDEVEDNKALDSSGNGYDGVVKGAPRFIEDGRFDGALDFAGGGDSVEIPDNDAMNFGTNSFSAVMWFNFSNAQDWNRMLRERNPGAWQNGSNGWEYQTQGTQIHMSVDDKKGRHYRTTYAGVGDGNWHHAAMILDREQGYLVSYLDGAQKLQTKLGLLDSVTDNLPIVIGGGFVGSIDEVAVFNAAISEEDVKNIFSEGLMKAINPLAVSAKGKVAATWAKIKTQH